VRLNLVIRCFRFDTVDAIIEALDKEKPTSFTRESKSKLLHYSPTSLRVILRLLRAGAKMSLGECLKMEYDLVQKFLVSILYGSITFYVTFNHFAV
jgi:3-hydroxyisobutyryl-CoA hydrolase